MATTIMITTTITPIIIHIRTVVAIVTTLIDAVLSRDGDAPIADSCLRRDCHRPTGPLGSQTNVVCRPAPATLAKWIVLIPDDRCDAGCSGL
ncbi:MAG: hypothetical protein AB7E84_16610 [Xanthobacteraceae bacterium]